MEYPRQPVLEPEDYPIPVIEPQLRPYHAPSYGRRLIYLKEYVTEFKNGVHYPPVCPGVDPPGACRPCVEFCLHVMADLLGKLLSTAPSSDLPTEFYDLTKLEGLSRDFFEVEGDLGGWVWLLIDRKLLSLEGSRLAKEMSMKPWRDEGRIFFVDRPMGYAYLQELKKRKRSIGRTLVEVIKDLGAVPQSCSDYLLSEMLAAGIPVDAVVTALEETLDIDVQLVLDSDDSEVEEVVDIEEGLVSNHLGVASTEEVDIAPAPTPLEDAQSQPSEPPRPDLSEVQSTPNSISSPASSGPVDDSIENGSREGATSPIQNTQGSGSDFVDRDSNHGNAPASPEPVDDSIETGPHEQAATAIQSTGGLNLHIVDRDFTHENALEAPTTLEPTDDEEELVEDAFFTPRKTRGLEFEVIEREPSEVRAPAPPQLGAGRWHC
ncbi:MAG: hypothetical protein L6R38_006928 [Xanthoria sp. 2 TBL-2021]|nr:MAG: hypothetical protein L6R38_006928 [Xanthoria sp. 2 TBL-2021]